MALPQMLLTFGLALCLGAGLGSLPARAGVPSSCIHPRANPIECPRDTRRVTHRVLPQARLNALREQRHQIEHVAPREDRRRNRTLREIRDGMRCESC